MSLAIGRNVCPPHGLVPRAGASGVVHGSEWRAGAGSMSRAFVTRLDAAMLPPDRWRHAPLFRRLLGGLRWALRWKRRMPAPLPSLRDGTCPRSDPRRSALAAPRTAVTFSTLAPRASCGSADGGTLTFMRPVSVVRPPLTPRCRQPLGDAAGIGLEALGNGWAQPGR